MLYYCKCSGHKGGKLMLKRRSKKKEKVSFFKCFYIGLLTLLLVLVLGQEWKIYQVKKGIERAEMQRRDLVAEKEKLETEIKNLNDLKYIEKVARSQYKLIKPNEVPIVIRE